MKGCLIINYPIENQIAAGNLETLHPMWEAYLQECDEFTILHPGKQDYSFVWTGLDGLNKNVVCKKSHRATLQMAAKREDADVYRALFPFSAWCVPDGKPLIYSVHCNRNLPENKSHTIKDNVVEWMHDHSMQRAAVTAANSKYLKQVYGTKHVHYNFWMPGFTPNLGPRAHGGCVYVGREDKFTHEWDAPNLPQLATIVSDIPHDQLPELYQQHHVSVVPIMGGFTIIESLACGTPVVSADYEWSSEIIKDGVNGFLFPRGDWEQMAKLVKEAETMDWDRARVAKTVEHMTAQAHMDREIKFIKEALK